MSSFFFQDHRSLSPTFRGPVAGIDCLSADALPGHMVTGVIQATHGAIHVDDTEMSATVAARVASGVAGVLILLRVSERGQETLLGLQHQVVKATAVAVYILNARNQSALTEACLKEFCAMTQAQADLVLAETLTGIHPDLRALFEKPIAAEILPALSILCQGFLAVQCGPGDGADGLAVDVNDPGGTIGGALRERMKWGDVLRSAQSLASQLTSLDQEARKPLRAQVSQASFWAVFEQTDSTTLAQAAEREWKSFRCAGKFAASKTKSLIDHLPQKDGGLADEDFGTRVAEAYLELAKRLEESR